MKSSYEVRAKKFINQIAPYIPIILNSTTVNYLRQAIYEFNTIHHRKVRMYKGYTRVALITSDYVIKLDYNKDAMFGDCETEFHMYEIAECDGYDYLFAKITRYTVNGIDFYIMPKINGINENSDREAWEYMTPSEYDWCTEHNIIDLHSGNFGWKNNHIIIFDYAATNGCYTGSSTW